MAQGGNSIHYSLSERSRFFTGQLRKCHATKILKANFEIVQYCHKGIKAGCRSTTLFELETQEVTFITHGLHSQTAPLCLNSEVFWGSVDRAEFEQPAKVWSLRPHCLEALNPKLRPRHLRKLMFEAKQRES